MLKKILTSKKGEMYIDAVVTLLVVIALLVFSLSVLRVAPVQSRLDTIADQLIELACYKGCFDSEFYARVEQIKQSNSDLQLEITSGADKWFNDSLHRVQLGESMHVTVRCEFKFMGSKPITLTATRTGVSENYWK